MGRMIGCDTLQGLTVHTINQEGFYNDARSFILGVLYNFDLVGKMKDDDQNVKDLEQGSVQ